MIRMILFSLYITTALGCAPTTSVNTPVLSTSTLATTLPDCSSTSSVCSTTSFFDSTSPSLGFTTSSPTSPSVVTTATPITTTSTVPSSTPMQTTTTATMTTTVPTTTTVPPGCCHYPIRPDSTNSANPQEPTWNKCNQSVSLTCQNSGPPTNVISVSVLGDYDTVTDIAENIVSTGLSEVRVTVLCDTVQQQWYVNGQSKHYDRFSCVWLLPNGNYYPI